MIRRAMRNDPKNRVLIIGNPSEEFDKIAEILWHGDYCRVTCASDVTDVVELSTNQYWDAVLIDGGTISITAADMCRVLKKRSITAPILVRSPCVSDPEEIICLDAGAMDFFSSGIVTEVLVARLRSHIRRYRDSGRAKFPIGRLVLDPTNKTLTDPETCNELCLTNSQVELLKYLCLADGREVSFDELKTEVWHYDQDALTHTMSSNISKLKQKISSELQCKNVLCGSRTGYRIGSAEKISGRPKPR